MLLEFNSWIFSKTPLFKKEPPLQPISLMLDALREGRHYRDYWRGTKELLYRLEEWQKIRKLGVTNIELRERLASAGASQQTPEMLGYMTFESAEYDSMVALVHAEQVSIPSEQEIISLPATYTDCKAFEAKIGLEPLRLKITDDLKSSLSNKREVREDLQKVRKILEGLNGMKEKTSSLSQLQPEYRETLVLYYAGLIDEFKRYEYELYRKVFS